SYRASQTTFQNLQIDGIMKMNPKKLILTALLVLASQASALPEKLLNATPVATNVSHITLVSTRLNSNQNASTADNDDDKTFCKKLVPGLGRMTQGIDISVLDLFPPDITAPSGFLRPIFEYTCNEERPWYDPF